MIYHLFKIYCCAILVFLCALSCTETPIAPAAPCSVEVPLTSTLDTCFELPRSIGGGPITTPPVLDYWYEPLAFATQEEGVIYFVRTDTLPTNAATAVEAYELDFCNFTKRLHTELPRRSRFWSTNSQGDIINFVFPTAINLHESDNPDMPLELQGAGDYLSIQWLNDQQYHYSRWLGNGNFESFIADVSGQENVIDGQVLHNNLFDCRNNRCIIYKDNNSPYNGYLTIYDIATGEEEILYNLDSVLNVDHAGLITWLNEEEIIINLGTREIIRFNYVTQSYQTLITSNGCENIVRRPPILKFPDRDMILYTRLDYVYDENDNYRRRYRLATLDLNTLEEQVLAVDE